MCKVPITTLHQILSDPRYEGRPLRREICTAIKRTDATLSRVLSEEARLDHNQSSDLGRWLCDELDETRWSRCYVGNTYLILPRRFGRANGRHDDDACALLEAGGDWVRHMNRGDKAMANQSLDRIRGEIIPNMQAETDAL